MKKIFILAAAVFGLLTGTASADGVGKLRREIRAALASPAPFGGAITIDAGGGSGNGLYIADSGGNLDVQLFESAGEANLSGLGGVALLYAGSSRIKVENTEVFFFVDPVLITAGGASLGTVTYPWNDVLIGDATAQVQLTHDGTTDGLLVISDPNAVTSPGIKLTNTTVTYDGVNGGLTMNATAGTNGITVTSGASAARIQYQASGAFQIEDPNAASNARLWIAHSSGALAGKLGYTSDGVNPGIWVDALLDVYGSTAAGKLRLFSAAAASGGAQLKFGAAGLLTISDPGAALPGRMGFDNAAGTESVRIGMDAGEGVGRLLVYDPTGSRGGGLSLFNSAGTAATRIDYVSAGVVSISDGASGSDSSLNVSNAAGTATAKYGATGTNALITANASIVLRPNNAGNTLTITGGASGLITWNGANLLDLGSSSLELRNVYAGTAIFHGTSQSVQQQGWQTALVDATATDLVTIACVTSEMVGGAFDISIYASDGTDFQVLTETVRFSAVNKAGTITSDVTATATADDSSSMSAGTLMATYDVTTTATSFTIRVNANSSLTTTSLIGHAHIRAMTSNTVTPQ